MKSEFDYQSAPYDFGHCFNGQCACADKCLRHLLAVHLPANRDYVTVVNPNKVVTDGKSCPFFREKRLVRFAVGMIHLYDNLTYRDAAIVKRPIYSYFGRSTYYRMRNRKRLITPEEQMFIENVFRKQGITARPVFDGYKDDYDWE